MCVGLDSNGANTELIAHPEEQLKTLTFKGIDSRTCVEMGDYVRTHGRMLAADMNGMYREMFVAQIFEAVNFSMREAHDTGTPFVLRDALASEADAMQEGRRESTRGRSKGGFYEIHELVERDLRDLARAV